MQGTVKYVKEDKGYGFLTTEIGDVFYHVRSVNGVPPKQGDVCYFDPYESNKGMQAINISVISFKLI